MQNLTALRPSLSVPVIQRLTGILMQLDLATVDLVLQNDDILNSRVDEAVQALQQHRPELLFLTGDISIVPLAVPPSPPVINKPQSAVGSTKDEEKVEDKLNDDEEPLFYEPGRPGFFALRSGKYSPARLTAFRNVGRYGQRTGFFFGFFCLYIFVVFFFSEKCVVNFFFKIFFRLNRNIFILFY